MLFLGSWLARENSRHLATLSLVSPPNDVWELNERRNSILMTHHYPDLASTSDWSCRVRNLLQPIRSTTQIWVVMRHQYGISLLISQTSFGGETSGKLMLQIFGCFLRLFWVGFSWPHHSKKVDWWWILLCLLNSGNTFYELLAFQIKQILLSLSELLRLIAIKVINIFFH